MPKTIKFASRASLEETLVLENAVEFPCPCGGRAVAASEPQAVVLHSLPYCAKFDELEPDLFVAYCRRALEN